MLRGKPSQIKLFFLCEEEKLIVARSVFGLLFLVFLVGYRPRPISAEGNPFHQTIPALVSFLPSLVEFDLPRRRKQAISLSLINGMDCLVLID